MKFFLVLFLLFPSIVFSQKSELIKNDTILFNHHKYPTVFIRLSNDSWSNHAMVFIADKKNFAYFKNTIPKIYFSRLQEYTDYYLIGIESLETNQYKKKIISDFLSKIDSIRMIEGNSVFLKNYNLDQQTGKITYLNTFKSLKEVDNLYYLFSKKDICKYMLCRIQYRK